MAKSKSKSIVPAWKQVLVKAAEAGYTAKEKPTSGEVISVSSGKFSLGDKVLGREIDCVILSWAIDYSYYTADYVKGESSSPACFAIGYDEEVLAPEESSPNKQGGDEGDCATCWANEYGSSSKGDGKACGNRRRLILAVENNGDVELKMLRVPPTSLKNWRGFIGEIEEAGLHTLQCTVKLKFDEDSTATQPPMEFEFLKEITDESTLIKMSKAFDQSLKLLNTPYDVSNYKPPKVGKKKVSKKKVSKKKTGRSKFSPE